MKCSEVIRLLETNVDAATRARLQAHARTCSACNLYIAMGLARVPTEPLAELVGRFARGSQPFQPGKRIGGHFTVIRVLGQGGMGVVAEVEDDHGKRFALKTAWAGDNPSILERAMREARATKSLNHPGLVQTVHWFLERDRCYLVMELLEGTTLREELARLRGAATRMDTTRARDLTLQLLDAMACAHEAGLIHRDLKPENLMLCGAPGLTGAPRLKVLDFGLVKPKATVGYETTLGQRMGTPVYAAPEVLAEVGTASVDARADLYSIGMVLLEMLSGSNTGELPRLRTEITDGTTQRRLLPKLSPALLTLLASTLATSPSRRPASARDIARQLREIDFEGRRNAK